MTDGSERVVSEVGAGGDVEGVQLGAVAGQAVHRLVGQLAAGGQVQHLDVAAVGGEAAQGRVANILQTRGMKVSQVSMIQLLHLTTLEAEALEEAATPLGQVLHHSSLNVNLKLKQVNFLPV